MADFTIKVFRPDGDPVPPSRVRAIGNQLAALAEEFEKMKGDGTVILNQTSALDSVTEQVGTWTGDAKDAVELILESLSVQLWNGTEKDRDIPFGDPEARRAVDLKFVFEEDGQMVVPVPTKKNIERGLKYAPLELPEEYDNLISQKAAVSIANGLAAVINADPGLSSLGSAEKSAIRDHVLAVVDKLRQGIEGDQGIFKAQLGDYSVRQCAG